MDCNGCKTLTEGEIRDIRTTLGLLRAEKVGLERDLELTEDQAKAAGQTSEKGDDAVREFNDKRTAIRDRINKVEDEIHRLEMALRYGYFIDE